jgi:peptidyl-prolyl cis-trans isomerase C
VIRFHSSFVTAVAAVGLATAGFALGTSVPALSQSAVVAKVNGKVITEADLKLADAEIGNDLGSLPEDTKRRVLVEYLIEHSLFADAAEAQKLTSGAAFDERMQYWRRRALRDTYFDVKIRDAVSDTEAKKFYEAQVSQLKPQEEIKARHILVESKEKAVEIFEKIAHGAEFAQMAKEFSKDPGTKDEGGDLGFFGRGQMVPQFEEAAFKLASGDVSQPVETQFGWHLIRIDERRERKPPAFEQIKDRIVLSMVHRKAQEAIAEFRKGAQIEYVDPAIKKQVDQENAGQPAQPKQ